MNKMTDIQPLSIGETFYYHSDHLGSAAYLTYHGGVIQTLNYLPYGEDWVEYNFFHPDDTTRLGIYRFNGKEKDYESGFHYYGARYYWSEILTSWLSIDPQIDELPQLSAYSYCNSNPVLLKDPDGEFPWVAIGAAVGAAYRAGVAVYEGESVREVAGAAVKGAIEGALITSGAGAWASVGANVIGAAVGEAAEQLIGKGSVDGGKVLAAAAGGLVSGAGGKVLNKGATTVANKATQKVEQKYASVATQKAIRKEVQAEVKSQGKTMGHSTRTQVNKTTAVRVQNLKAVDKRVVDAKAKVTKVAGNTALNAAGNKVANKINSK